MVGEWGEEEAARREIVLVLDEQYRHSYRKGNMDKRLSISLSILFVKFFNTIF